MLIVKSIPRDAVKTKHTYHGKEISFDLRPIDAEIMTEIRDSITTYEFAQDPITRKMQRVTIVDDESYDSALFDHIIAGWSGLGVSRTEELPCTKENKLKVARLRPSKKDKVSLEVWLIRTAGELGSQLHEEMEAEIKN